MRVIAGSARGATLQAVPGDTTRPILDRVKTTLFDMLRPELEGTQLLDLFGGAGSIGIEALSQGAGHCVFLDLAAPAVATIRKNLEKTKLQDKAEVRHADAFSYLKQTSKTFDIIFIAPPQYKGLWIEAMQVLAERPHILKDDGVIVVQIDPKEYESLNLTTFKEAKERTHGNSQLLFFRKVLG